MILYILFSRNVIAQESLRLNSDEATQKTVSKEDLSEAEKRLTEEVETLAKEANAIKERTLELEVVVFTHMHFCACHLC